MRILIVDDDLINRKFLKAMLTGYGDIFMAEDGTAAIELIREGIKQQNPFDIIFLDIMMPRMNGHETLIEIRQIEKANDILLGNGAKVVMVTALANQENVLTAFSEGCEYYLVKPVQQSRLFELMAEMGIYPSSEVRP
jgi:two-component system, chemotaxis family, chemotaxis protein CheY